MAQIPAKMKALVNHGPHDYRLEMIDTPMPGPNEVLIKVGACGICAGDIKCEAGAKMFWGENPWVKTPVVPGHEFFGTVVAMGEGAEEHFGVKMGERILAEQILPCGKCRFCKSGQYWMCQPHDMYGYQGKIADGGMAEYMLFHPNSVIHKIPDALSLEDAAFIEPMACSMHTTERANIQFEDVVVLAGAGTLGLGIVQAAALKHPKKLVVLDTIDARLELAKKFGADVEYDFGFAKVAAGVSAKNLGYAKAMSDLDKLSADAQKDSDKDRVNNVILGASASVSTDQIIPGAELKLAWENADDLLKVYKYDADAEKYNFGKITASCSISF